MYLNERCLNCAFSTTRQPQTRSRISCRLQGGPYNLSLNGFWSAGVPCSCRCRLFGLSCISSTLILSLSNTTFFCSAASSSAGSAFFLGFRCCRRCLSIAIVDPVAVCLHRFHPENRVAYSSRTSCMQLSHQSVRLLNPALSMKHGLSS